MRLAPPQRSTVTPWLRGDAVDVRVVRTHDDEGVRDQVARQEGVEGVAQHRLAAEPDVLLGAAAPMRAPTPAAGMRAK
jgi:hypothetical protein